MKKIKNKRKLFLIIYAIVIGGLLIFILCAPTSFFLSKTSRELLSVSEKEYPSIDSLFDVFVNDNYAYSYNLLDSMKSKSVIYKCNGQIVNGSDIGTCVEPSYLEYNSSNKEVVLENVKFDLLDLSYIHKLIKDKESSVKEYDGVRCLTYKDVLVDDMSYDVIIYSDYKRITEIQVVNAYVTYVIKFSEIDG